MIFVGRHAQLKMIESAISDPPAFIRVSGQAGSGKTVLVRQLLARADAGTRVIIGYCHPVRERFPFEPVIEALVAVGPSLVPRGRLGSRTGMLRPLIPEFAARLPAMPTRTGNAAIDRHRLFRAFRDLLNSIGPGVLVVEDGQWMDLGTGELLMFLASRPPSQLSVVVTYRPEESVPGSAIDSLWANVPSRSSIVEVTLPPFRREELAELAEATLQPAPSGAVVDELLHRTGGLPLAAHDMIAMLSGLPGLTHADRRAAQRSVDEAGIPASLTRWLLQRAHSLMPDTIAAIRAAAIIGQPAEAQLIKEVSNLSRQNLPAAISQALTMRILCQNQDQFHFMVPVMRQTIYEAVPDPQRRVAHERTVRALMRRKPRPYAQLAEHARRAGLAQWWRHAETGAAQAIAAGRAEEATRLLLDALSARGLPKTAKERMARNLAAFAVDGLTHGATTVLLRTALTQSGLSVAARGELRLNLGLMLTNQLGEVQSGRREIEEAVPDLATQPALLARAMSALSVPMWAAEPVKHHLSRMEQAVQAASLAGDRVVTIAVRVNQVTTLLQAGEPEGWRLLVSLPVGSTDPEELRHLARGACSHADAAGWLGHLRGADELIDRADKLSAESGAGFAASITTATRLRIDWYQGRWRDLAHRADAAMTNTADVRQAVTEARLVRGLLRLAQGDFTAAVTDLQAACVGQPDIAIPMGLAGSAALCELWLSRGLTREAVSVTDEAIGLLGTTENWVWASDIAPAAVDCYLAAGIPGKAHRLVADMGSGLAGRDCPGGQAALAACQARLSEADGKHHVAALAFARAARLYAALPQPYAVARELASAGRCRHKNEHELAQRSMAMALVRFEALGAAWAASKCRQFMRENGFPVSHRRGRRGYGSELSPRERDVARLVVAGKTNREIAAALFLSPRTVEDHIAGAMKKLGLSSRAQLTTSLQ